MSYKSGVVLVSIGLGFLLWFFLAPVPKLWLVITGAILVLFGMTLQRNK